MAPARLIRFEIASSVEWGAFVAVSTAFTEGIGRTPPKGFSFSEKNFEGTKKRGAFRPRASKNNR